jgi:hypothetical protein
MRKHDLRPSAGVRFHVRANSLDFASSIPLQCRMIPMPTMRCCARDHLAVRGAKCNGSHIAYDLRRIGEPTAPSAVGHMSW